LLTRALAFSRTRARTHIRRRENCVHQCNSERVPGKNFRLLCGRPLYAWTLSALLSSTRIERVVINTDSTTLEDEIRAQFPADAHRVQARCPRAHACAPPARRALACLLHRRHAPPCARAVAPNTHGAAARKLFEKSQRMHARKRALTHTPRRRPAPAHPRQILERPAALRGDMVPMNTILAHDVSVVAADVFLQTHTTNPFLTTDTLDKAIDAFLVRTTRARCCVKSKEEEASCSRSHLTPLAPAPATMMRHRLRSLRTTRSSPCAPCARACTTRWGAPSTTTRACCCARRTCHHCSRHAAHACLRLCVYRCYCCCCCC
jgi:hypothetical protein